MVALISLVQNDYVLALCYVVISFVCWKIFKLKKDDLVVYLFGLVAMTVSEYFFIHTGVETFARVSLFGIMPLWLPFLWAYGFVTIKRTVSILETVQEKIL